MKTDFDPKFLAPLLHFGDRCLEGVHPEVCRNMLGPRSGCALEPLAFAFVADESLHSDRNNGDAFVSIDFDNPLPTFQVVEVRMDRSDFDRIQSDLLDFICNNRVVFKLPEAVALHSKLSCL